MTLTGYINEVGQRAVLAEFLLEPVDPDAAREATIPDALDTKETFLAAWERGLLGNRLRTWSSYQAIVDDGYRGEVAIRCRVRDSQHALYGVPFAQIPFELSFLASESGLLESQFYFGESAPDEKLKMQGEISHDLIHGWKLTYSTKPGLRMRPAMSNEFGVQHATGMKALAIVRHYMDDNSFADLEALLDRWPNACFEFSVYRCNLGCFPNRNTAIWEGREY